jgi:glycosyltransferase involved in cell wall biosynthesis
VRPPLRVAHVVATVGTSGVESYLITLLPSFDPAEAQPVLFVPGEGPLVDRLRERGVPVEPGAPTRKLAWRDADRLAGRLRGRFDLVHAHGPRAAFWAERAARRARVPAFLATVHELRWQTMPAGFRRDVWIALEGRTMRRAQRLITVSEATRRDLVARFPDLADRTRVVHASAPLLLESGRLPRAAPDRAGDPLRLVTVGRFAWQKGYDLLLRALALLGQRGVPFTIDIVGFGPDRVRLEEAAVRLGLEGRVRWRAADTDVPALLAGADVFVTATRAEMFGIAVLEAMAIGLPVVAPAVGSLPELIVDGETGVLVSPAPETAVPERIARALAELGADPARRGRLGEAAAGRARNVFGPPAVAAGVTRVYRELVGDSPPR